MPRLSGFDDINRIGGPQQEGPQGPDPPAQLSQEEQLEKVLSHFERVNEFFIQKVAAQSARVG